MKVSRIGVDGCREGWVCAFVEDECPKTVVLASFEEVLRHFSEAIIAIDIPIGLPSQGSRRCDLAARKLLGRPRGSSVFPAPLRCMLTADTFAEACDFGRAADGRALTQQCWGILPKIREADAVKLSIHLERIFEVHPEVSFFALNGRRPMVFRKTRHEGKAERRAALSRAFGDNWSPTTPKGAKMDDVLDAYVALWSAGRITNSNSRMVTDVVEHDATGLRMQIYY